MMMMMQGAVRRIRTAHAQGFTRNYTQLWARLVEEEAKRPHGGVGGGGPLGDGGCAGGAFLGDGGVWVVLAAAVGEAPFALEALQLLEGLAGHQHRILAADALEPSFDQGEPVTIGRDHLQRAVLELEQGVNLKPSGSAVLVASVQEVGCRGDFMWARSSRQPADSQEQK